MRAKKGHLLQTENLVRSKKWRELPVPGDFERLVYCLLVGGVDSWGMMPADPCTLKAELDPMAGTHAEADYISAVNVLTGVKLIQVWLHQGDPWLRVVGHDEIQKAGIRRRSAEPAVPIPEWSGSGPGVVLELSGSGPGPGVVRDNSRYEVEVEVESEVEGEVEMQKSPPSPSTTTPRIGAILPGAIAQSRAAPPDRSQSAALVPDSRAGGLQPELEELRHAYAAAWSVDPALVPLPAGDHLERVRAALSDNQAGLTRDERISNAFAAIQGHHREASKDGSSYGRDLIHVFPPLRKGDKARSSELDFSRYMKFARGSMSTRVETESSSERERREREKEIEREGTEGRAEKAAVGREEFEAAVKGVKG